MLPNRLSVALCYYLYGNCQNFTVIVQCSVIKSSMQYSFPCHKMELCYDIND